MATLEINLPEPLKEFVDAQVADGNYESASEFLKTLLSEAQEKARRRSVAREHLEVLLLEGLNSGPEIEVTPEFWEERRAVLLARRAERQSAAQEK